MISQLSGKILSISDKYLVIDVNGIGYKVFCSSQTIISFKDNLDAVTVLTELIVREDSLTLFGFSNLQEKTWFNLLISVQGVGAKAALAILSSISLEEMSLAIINSDKALITRAEGIGPKIAGRILNELKDKIPNISIDPLFSKENENIVNENIDIIEDAISALSNLGYNKLECKKIVVNVYSNLSVGATLSELISISLKKLGNK